MASKMYENKIIINRKTNYFFTHNNNKRIVQQQIKVNSTGISTPTKAKKYINYKVWAAAARDTEFELILLMII